MIATRYTGIAILVSGILPENNNKFYACTALVNIIPPSVKEHNNNAMMHCPEVVASYYYIPTWYVVYTVYQL